MEHFLWNRDRPAYRELTVLCYVFLPKSWESSCKFDSRATSSQIVIKAFATRKCVSISEETPVCLQFTNPLEAAWEHMDRKLLRKFWSRREDEFVNAASISEKVLVMHRGIHLVSLIKPY